MFNSNADQKEAKRKVRREFRCDRCPPHRGENVERAPRRSWKHRSKKARQHRG